MTDTSQIAVSGYYGCGNAGDEAVLAGIQEAFTRRAGANVSLIALSQDPAATTRQHGLRSEDRMSLNALRNAFRESHLLLSGGGSLLQDTTSVRSLLYYLWVARVALNMQVPIMFYAQGLGPLRRAMSRSLVRVVANRAAYITVRDEASARLLAAIGVTKPTMEVTADPAFALSPAPENAIAQVMHDEGLLTDRPLLGVALRPWGGTGESPVASYAHLLTELSKQTGARIVLLPMQIPGDVEFAETVAQQTGCAEEFPVIRGTYTPAVLLGLVGRMQSVVAMRLHALIFAARAGVPPFALSYDPKVEHLMQILGMENALEHWRGFEPSEVAQRVGEQIADREAISGRLLAKMPALESLALRNADCALTVLERNRSVRALLKT